LTAPQHKCAMCHEGFWTTETFKLHLRSPQHLDRIKAISTEDSDDFASDHAPRGSTDGSLDGDSAQPISAEAADTMASGRMATANRLADAQFGKAIEVARSSSRAWAEFARNAGQAATPQQPPLSVATPQHAQSTASSTDSVAPVHRSVLPLGSLVLVCWVVSGEKFCNCNHAHSCCSRHACPWTGCFTRAC
jgi:hypothetical protein